MLIADDWSSDEVDRITPHRSMRRKHNRRKQHSVPRIADDWSSDEVDRITPHRSMRRKHNRRKQHSVPRIADDWSSDEVDRITPHRSMRRKHNRRKQHSVPRMADDWSSDEEDRITPHMYKVPASGIIPPGILAFNIKLVAEIHSMHKTLGPHKLGQLIAQRFEHTRRGKYAALIESNGEDRDVILMVRSYWFAYLCKKENIFKQKIKKVLKEIHDYDVKFYNVIKVIINTHLYYIAASQGDSKKGFKLLQESRNCVHNLASGALTAGVYMHLAEMYDQLAYLMPYRKTSSLDSAMNWYRVARGHWSCERENGDQKDVGNQIYKIMLRMINIKLQMPNRYSMTCILYASSQVAGSGRICSVTDHDISIATDMRDTLIKQQSILGDTTSIKYMCLAKDCLLYLYMRQAQVKKQATEYTFALDACITAMRLYNKLFHYHKLFRNCAQMRQIGHVILDLFHEVCRNLKATPVVKPHAHNDEFVHSAECYTDEAVLCDSRLQGDEPPITESSDDKWGRSDTSFNLSSQSEADDGKKPQQTENKGQEADDDPEVEVMRDDSSDAHRAALCKLRQVNTDPSVTQFILNVCEAKYSRNVREAVQQFQNIRRTKTRNYKGEKSEHCYSQAIGSTTQAGLAASADDSWVELFAQSTHVDKTQLNYSWNKVSQSGYKATYNEAACHVDSESDIANTGPNTNYMYTENDDEGCDAAYSVLEESDLSTGDKAQDGASELISDDNDPEVEVMTHLVHSPVNPINTMISQILPFMQPFVEGFKDQMFSKSTYSKRKTSNMEKGNDPEQLNTEKGIPASKSSQFLRSSLYDHTGYNTYLHGAKDRLAQPQKLKGNSVASQFDGDTDDSDHSTGADDLAPLDTQLASEMKSCVGSAILESSFVQHKQELNATSLTSVDSKKSKNKSIETNQPVSNKYEAKHDPHIDDLTDSSDLCESSPNEDSQDTEVMEGY